MNVFESTSHYYDEDEAECAFCPRCSLKRNPDEDLCGPCQDDAARTI